MDYNTLTTLIETYQKTFQNDNNSVSKEKLLTDTIVLSKYIEIKLDKIVQQLKTVNSNELTILSTGVKFKFLADFLDLMDRQLGQ